MNKKSDARSRGVARAKFRVGDVVTFLYGNGRVRGTIVEDRGCLGRGGRRLYGIRFEPNPEDYAYTEMGDEELSPAKP